ncbi:MAG: hypothetical protein QOG97_1890, partial [Acidimicrobiaceae bacterium]|nr:hypothetical protein [Acidimicrobiaceae bacterium]
MVRTDVISSGQRGGSGNANASAYTPWRRADAYGSGDDGHGDTELRCGTLDDSPDVAVGTEPQLIVVRESRSQGFSDQPPGGPHPSGDGRRFIEQRTGVKNRNDFRMGMADDITAGRAQLGKELESWPPRGLWTAWRSLQCRLVGST